MSGFSFRHDDLQYEFELTDLQQLKLHEAILPEQMNILAENIKEMGYLKDPVIVDAESYTILDGHHRVQALRKIGCSRVLTCKINHQNTKVKLMFWFRVINNLDVDRIESILKKKSIDLQKNNNTSSNVEKIITDHKLISAFISEKKILYYSTINWTAIKAYDIVKLVEKELKRFGEFTYLIEDDAVTKALQGKVKTTMAIPRLSKKDVINLAISGYLLPPKTTRHIIPARPLGINIPLQLLKNKEMDDKEANRRLCELLKKKKIHKQGPNVSYDDRFYEEYIYVFE